MNLSKFSLIISMGAILLSASVVFCGSKKTDPVQAEQQKIATTAPDPNTAVEQKTCPVMGNPINKKIYTVYKGKKVYFCCSGCKPEFEKNPDKYISKLPQFAK